jgi:two-component system response regulator HydG
MTKLFDGKIWKTIIDTMHEGLMLVDPQGRIRFVNQSLEQMTGYSNEELVGKSCEIFCGDQCSKVRADGFDKYCALFKEKKVVRVESVFRCKDGSPLPLLKNASVIYDNKGKVSGGVETLTDLRKVKAGERIIKSLEKQLHIDRGFAGIIGESVLIRQVFSLVENAAASEVPVVFLGESGTGKELLAAALHRLSNRAGEPFVKVNCAALNENLLESELFGHVKGAFTGADLPRTGRFEAAHHGTIFLDEIGDIPLRSQTKLLRVLQENEIERVGDQRPIKIDVRLITATNKDLHALVEAGKFREDLFYRINVVPVEVPPLRERMGDIPILVHNFIKDIAQKTGKDIHRIDTAALALLNNYHWPGNVRELINVIAYAFVVCPRGGIGVEHLPATFRDAPHPEQTIVDAPRQTPVEEHRTRILSALSDCGWNRTKAAAILGVSRVTLWKWTKKHGIN